MNRSSYSISDTLNPNEVNYISRIELTWAIVLMRSEYQVSSVLTKNHNTIGVLMLSANKMYKLCIIGISSKVKRKYSITWAIVLMSFPYSHRSSPVTIDHKLSSVRGMFSIMITIFMFIITVLYTSIWK